MLPDLLILQGKRGLRVFIWSSLISKCCLKSKKNPTNQSSMWTKQVLRLHVAWGWLVCMFVVAFGSSLIFCTASSGPCSHHGSGRHSGITTTIPHKWGKGEEEGSVLTELLNSFPRKTKVPPSPPKILAWRLRHGLRNQTVWVQSLTSPFRTCMIYTIPLTSLSLNVLIYQNSYWEFDDVHRALCTTAGIKELLRYWSLLLSWVTWSFFSFLYHHL